MKIVHLFQGKKYIYNELADKKLKEITELDEDVNHNDLVHRCKSKSPDEKFGKHDNPLDPIDKIRNSEIKITDAKNDQIIFKSHCDEIKKGNNKEKSKEQKNQNSKKPHYTILKCFTKLKKRLLNYLMIIIQ